MVEELFSVEHPDAAKYRMVFSGFSEAFLATYADAGRTAEGKLLICIRLLETPLGLMCGGASEQGVCFIEFMTRVKLEPELTRLCKELNAVIGPGASQHLDQLEQELQAYFNRTLTEFTVPLHLTGSDFQKEVWNTLLLIPYGKTWSYKQQALKMNKLEAIRAMAAANGQNKHAIVIPCHRVIGSNGSLTGYAGGLAKKEWLLRFEMERVQGTLDLF